MAAPMSQEAPQVIQAQPATVAAPSGTAVVARQLVQLKVRLLRNRMGGSAARVLVFVVSLLLGVALALGGFTALAVGAADADPLVRRAAICLGGGALTVGWLLLPLLFFGVDETLDPARFALLPLRRRSLAVGMLSAACVGIAPTVTGLILLGLVAGAAIQGGFLAAALAVVAAALGVLSCVVSSRAVTSAFAQLLRSRRMRDLAAIMLAVLASSIGPLQLLVTAMVRDSGREYASSVAQVLGWTPLAAPYAAVADAVDGRWALVPLRLAIGLATVVGLLWWWSTTLESAMAGAGSSGPTGRALTTRGNLVSGFYPRLLRKLPVTAFTALVARESRYWWRDARRRASLFSVVISSAAVPLVTRLSFGSADTPSDGTISLPAVITFGGIVIGIALANQFGFDGPAYAGHLLIGVPGRTELLARAVSLALIGGPPTVLVAVVVGLFTDAAGQIPAALGTAAAALGVSLGVASVLSVLAPYSLPDSGNPFAVGSGGSMGKGLLAMAALLAAAAGTAPVLLAYLFLPSGLGAVILLLGLIWGSGATTLGAVIGGDRLDRRGPELLSAVTPRR